MSARMHEIWTIRCLGLDRSPSLSCQRRWMRWSHCIGWSLLQRGSFSDEPRCSNAAGPREASRIADANAGRALFRLAVTACALSCQERRPVPSNAWQVGCSAVWIPASLRHCSRRALNTRITRGPRCVVSASPCRRPWRSHFIRFRIT